MPGTLFVVATPLGHLDDFSPRAERVLRSVAGIACEDTRRTAKLLARFSIATPTYSHHRFNERTRLEEFLSMLRSGRDLALVSDAGTPGVADPGALLIREAAGLGIPVVPIPGPSAPIALLAVGLRRRSLRLRGLSSPSRIRSASFADRPQPKSIPDNGLRLPTAARVPHLAPSGDQGRVP